MLDMGFEPQVWLQIPTLTLTPAYVRAITQRNSAALHALAVSHASTAVVRVRLPTAAWVS